MGLLKRGTKTAPAVGAVQLRDAHRHPFTALDGYVPLRNGEIALYRAIREAVPVVDAAVAKLVRLCGGVSVQCRDRQAQAGMDRFLRTVPTGRGQMGIQSFLDCYLDSMLANGANAAYYRQTAMSFDGVAAVTVIPRSRGVGTVDVVAAAWGGMPDQTLLDELQACFEQTREIAVDVQVIAPTAAETDLTVTLTAESGYAFDRVSASVRQAVEGWFTGELLGRPVLQAELTALVFGVEGVANCTVALAGGDMPADSVTLPCLSSLTITEA